MKDYNLTIIAMISTGLASVTGIIATPTLTSFNFIIVLGLTLVMVAGFIHLLAMYIEEIVQRYSRKVIKN